MDTQQILKGSQTIGREIPKKQISSKNNHIFKSIVQNTFIPNQDNKNKEKLSENNI